ncbi:MAG: glycine--tRNA ligase [Candidatus Moranbacteria bacterium RIFOXYA12_FULL_35_19]|nr:MAG: glycine--tRNA ligase [Candidatus Moranbacteria bacterium RIFOXYB12_FULL_35_8]OGI35783.1 MAG: glycine--tRNA ligase [Candidatus Moranbacteria bacterium RIFOXYA12_FULL_35_19]
MEKIVSLCKRRGFVYPGSEIYGGLANSWDFGPYGIELKNNIKQNWWKTFVQNREDMVGLDSAIIMNPKVWEASGHLTEFSDPLVECLNCHDRLRADQIIKDMNSFSSVVKEFMIKAEILLDDINKDVNIAGILIDSSEQMLRDKKLTELNEKEKTTIKNIGEIYNYKLNSAKDKIKIGKNIIKEILNTKKYLGFITQIYLNRFETCPICGSMKWSTPKSFNLMFKTFIGPTENDSSVAYLRPETAQGIFVNFKNIIDSNSIKMPFGVAQIGKAFRNEITPGNFIFRTREFEQMEIEYFFNPEKTKWEVKFDELLEDFKKWMKEIGVDSKKLFFHDIEKEELAHYSKKTIDVEFDFPFGKKELFGLAYRTDFDLKNHKLNYKDQETQEEFTPHVIEPSVGVERMMLAVMLSAYTEEDALTADGKTEIRTVMKFSKNIAPIKVAILPLSKKEELLKISKEIWESLRPLFMTEHHISGSIGKRYRRQDEIGTPYCVTVDFETLNDKAVTVRDRDTMEQERIAIDKLEKYLGEKFKL